MKQYLFALYLYYRNFRHIQTHPHLFTHTRTHTHTHRNIYIFAHTEIYIFFSGTYFYLHRHLRANKLFFDCGKQEEKLMFMYLNQDN